MVFIPGNSLHLDDSGIHWTIGKHSCFTGSGSCLAVFGCVCVLAGTVSSTHSVTPRFDPGNMTGGTFIWASFLSSGSVLVTVAAFFCEERASSVCVLLFMWSTCSLVREGLILPEMCSGHGVLWSAPSLCRGTLPGACSEMDEIPNLGYIGFSSLAFSSWGHITAVTHRSCSPYIA